MTQQRPHRGKRARRTQARGVRRARQQGRQRQRRILLGIVAGFAGLAIIVGLFLPQFSPRSRSSPAASESPGEKVPIQGLQHIQPGESHPDYNSIPPTSGWHYVQPAPWGLSSSQIPNETQLHNLEHGGVLIQYDTEDTEMISQLEGIAEQQPGFPSCFIVAPYEGLGQPIALTAWGVIQRLDSYDEQAIQEFIGAYRNRGPEQIGANDCG